MDAQGILGSIHTLLPAIRLRSEEIEQSRRMPRDLIQDVRRTGMFGLGVPRAIGGEEGTPLDLMRAIELVASADGSAGWCAMIGLGSNMIAGYMNESGAKEVFADPSAPTAGIAAPAGAA